MKNAFGLLLIWECLGGAQRDGARAADPRGVAACALVAALVALAGATGRALARWRRRRARAAAARELRELSDAQLADIGVARAEIDDLLRGRRPHRGVDARHPRARRDGARAVPPTAAVKAAEQDMGLAA